MVIGRLQMSPFDILAPFMSLTSPLLTVDITMNNCNYLQNTLLRWCCNESTDANPLIYRHCLGKFPVMLGNVVRVLILSLKNARSEFVFYHIEQTVCVCFSVAVCRYFQNIILDQCMSFLVHKSTPLSVGGKHGYKILINYIMNSDWSWLSTIFGIDILWN